MEEDRERGEDAGPGKVRARGIPREDPDRRSKKVTVLAP